MDWNLNQKINSDFISRDLGDEIVLMSKDGQEIHSFEETGLWVWQKVLEGKNPETILQDMLEEFDVPEDRAREDLTSFFLDLLDKGIVETDNG